MEKYIEGNKAAWEEAFEMRSPLWGANIVERVSKEEYPFFNNDTVMTLKKLDLQNKVIGQFCCNNGRELLSIVKSSGAAKGIGFDIAENQIAFAKERADELGLPCEFKAVNVFDIGNEYTDRFDLVFITIGALCWLKDLDRFFDIVARSMKTNGRIVINEQHPFTNMIANEGEEGFDRAHPTNCIYSYFEHEWIGNSGMFYITGRSYPSKTFTDYTHSLSEIIGAMCRHGIAITDMKEFDYDISGSLENLNGKGYPLSFIVEGVKMPPAFAKNK